MWTAVGLGLLIGVSIGLLGSGGSILAVPALVYGVGLPVPAAVTTSLLVVGISSAVALVPRLRQVQWPVAAVFGLAGAVAAFGGTAVNRALSPTVVLVGFAVVMVAAAVQMLRGQGSDGGSCALPGGGVDWRSCVPKAFGAGLVVGFLTGLFGVGGGFLIVPALAMLLGLPMGTAVATSLVIVMTNALAGLVAHVAAGSQLNLGVAAPFTLAAIAGALVAGRVGARLPAERLRPAFAIMVLAVAAFVAIRALA